MRGNVRGFPLEVTACAYSTTMHTRGAKMAHSKLRSSYRIRMTRGKGHYGTVQQLQHYMGVLLQAVNGRPSWHVQLYERNDCSYFLNTTSISRQNHTLDKRVTVTISSPRLSYQQPPLFS